MSFNPCKKKGLNNYLVDADLADGCISLHVSELPPGKSSHEPHVHDGVESYYVFRGELTVSQGEEALRLAENDAASIDSSKPHKVTNTGLAVNKYMVIIAKPRIQPAGPTAPP
ncbi:MAG: cupin domain-containing protein [Phycisphaerae bacterium]|nr:cupin domain-containing protein [Phycisphaerae bacterium]